VAACDAVLYRRLLYGTFPAADCLQHTLDALGFAKKKMCKKDASSYLAFLQAIVKGISEEELEEVVKVVLAANSGPTLNRHQCMQLLRCCVAECLIPMCYLKLPACQALSPDDILELLQLCFEMPPFGADGDASSCSSDYFEGPSPRPPADYAATSA
jgi:hypothetical protein